MFLVLTGLLAGYFLLPLMLNGGSSSLIRTDKLTRAYVVIALGGDKRCEREKRAAELYQAGWAKKIVVCGVQFAWGVHTGEVAKQYINRLGVPESDILIMRDNWNTRAEARSLQQLMQ